jgi:hypothetical protein
MRMKLWMITHPDYSYDEYDVFIVWAKDENDARRRAGAKSADEGVECWLDPAQSTCEELLDKGKPGIVLGSFNAG